MTVRLASSLKAYMVPARPAATCGIGALMERVELCAGTSCTQRAEAVVLKSSATAGGACRWRMALD